MGKKDKKDKAKVEAKKQRQALKQAKATNKRTKKELKESGEEDIEAVLAEFARRDKSRTAVTITPCSQPSPRSNFSITALPSGEMLLFGGEFFDGDSTYVYNDLFKWNVERNEWKQIESLNTPPPRCSHQAVFFKDRVYIFGGEYATLDQFHHYRDLWYLDLKTNAWTEVRATGDLPSSRSGHRMVVWRSFLVLFGGFYEAMREVRWFNDLYLFSFQEERWWQVTYKLHSPAPKPRSGVQMCIHAHEDALFIYGGYSKEKVPGQKKEGKVHEDMWMLNLKSVLTTLGSSQSGGKVGIESQKAIWQKISKKGHFPSPRCGAVMALYKNKAILFGGVFDNEGLQHSMTSTFYSDMYAFDMERKRWYQLGLKQPKKPGASSKERRVMKKLASEGENNDGNAEGSDIEDNDEGEGEEEGDDEEEAQLVNQLLDRRANGNFFGYIDENGEVVYVDLEVEETVDSVPSESSQNNNHVKDLSQLCEGQLSPESACSCAPLEEALQQASVKESSGVDSKDAEILCETASPSSEKGSVGVLTKTGGKGRSEEGKVDQTQVVPANLSQYFLERRDPCPRINPCLMVRGNTLYIYGGVTEIGDIEFTLDDCWTLDLNKRDVWKCLVQGSMHTMVWKGEDLEGTETECSEDPRDHDSDDSDNDSSEEEEDEEEEEEEVTSEQEGVEGAQSQHRSTTFDSTPTPPSSGKKAVPVQPPRDNAEEKKVAKMSKKATAGEESGGGGTPLVERSTKKSSKSSTKDVGLRAEIASLRSELAVHDANRTPHSGEALRAFYSRTSGFWSEEVVRLWREKKVGDNSTANEAMSEKEIKREGFLLAEARFNELAPMLSRLDELEMQQKEMEEEMSSSSRKHGSKRR